MKNFGIILSILVLLCFAAACMQPEKDVFESAETQAQKLVNTNVITKDPAASGTTIYGGGSGPCVAPTNIVIQQINEVYNANMILTGYDIFFTWTPPTNAPSSYTVSLTGPNTNVVQTTNLNVFVYTFSVQNAGQYTLGVASNCSNSSSPQLVTSFEFGQFGGHGGTQITVVDDLDGVMYQQPSSTNFTYSPDFNNLTKFTVKPLNLQYATPPCATYNYTGTVNVTKPGYQTFQFTVPSIVNSIINTYCMENNANPKPLLDMTITSPLIKVGTVIAYEEQNSTSGWNTITVEDEVVTIINGNNMYAPSVKLPNLKRGVTYKVKFFSQYTMLGSYYTYGVNDCSIAPN